MNFFDELFYPTQTVGRRPFYSSTPFYQPRAYRVVDLDDIFDDEYTFAPRPKIQALRVPQVHLNEQKRGWVASINLPGVRSFEDVLLELDSDVLHIRAESYRRNQRQIYSHNLPLPEGADINEVRASFKNETLTILIPRQVKEVVAKPVPAPQEGKKEAENKPEEKQTTELQEKPQESNPPKPVTRPFFLSMPKVSHSQTETDQVVSIEFPEGWDVKENIDVEVCNGLLNISVSKKDNNASFSFRRSIALPAGVTESNVTAKLENNTLAVSYPKPVPPKSFKIPLLSSDSEPKPIESSNTAGSPVEQSTNLGSADSESNSPPTEEKEKEVTIETA